MQSLTKVQGVFERLNSIKEAGLTINEQQLLKFLKSLVKKQEELLNSLQKAVDQKNWEEVLSLSLQLTQRCNAILAYSMQPTVLGSIMDTSLYQIIDEIMETSASCIAEVVMLLKKNFKEIGIDSITMNLITNPLSVNLSITLKGS
ncbi:MAG: hypothetical protein OWQ54_01980 [Sulfolobaceae archaeon]|nr:hypothetical protein [Sulfolobaceae archaeon]